MTSHSDTLPASSYWRYIASAFHHLILYAGLMGLGGLIVWGAYISEEVNGAEIGFNDGCRTGLGPAAGFCDLTAEIGKKIRRIKMQSVPGKPLTDEQKLAIRAACNPPLASLPPELLHHYGCPDDDL